MRILLHGDFGPYELGASYQRAFASLGHEVILLDERARPAYLAPWLRNRWLHRLTIKSLRLRAAGAVRWNERLLELVRQSRPDLVLILKGDFLMPQTLRQVHDGGAPVFIFHPDNPFPPSYAHRPESVACMAACDVYLTFARTFVPDLRRAGAPRVEYLPFGWDGAVFPYDPADDHGTAHDVVFVGGWDRLRERMLTPVAKRFDLKIWGPGYWNTRTVPGSPLRRCWQGQGVYGPDAAAIMRRAKISLNVVRAEDADGANMRAFETPGCGGFGLSTRLPTAVEIFPEAEAGAYFGSVDELLAEIDRYLAAGDRRETVRRRAHEIVAREHTYVHRAQAIVGCRESLP